MCRLKRYDNCGMLPAGDDYPLEDFLSGKYMTIFNGMKLYEKELTQEDREIIFEQRRVAIQNLITDPAIGEVVYYTHPLYNQDNIAVANLIYLVRPDSLCDAYKSSGGKQFCCECYYLGYRIE